MKKDNRAYILIELLLAIVLVALFGNLIIKLVNSNIEANSRLKAKVGLEQLNHNLVELLYLDQDCDLDFQLDWENPGRDETSPGEIFEKFKAQDKSWQTIELKDYSLSLEKSNRGEDLWEVKYEIKSNKYKEIFMENRLLIKNR